MISELIRWIGNRHKHFSIFMEPRFIYSRNLQPFARIKLLLNIIQYIIRQCNAIPFSSVCVLRVVPFWIVTVFVYFVRNVFRFRLLRLEWFKIIEIRLLSILRFIEVLRKSIVKPFMICVWQIVRIRKLSQVSKFPHQDEVLRMCQKMNKNTNGLWRKTKWTTYWLSPWASPNIYFSLNE